MLSIKSYFLIFSALTAFSHMQSHAEWQPTNIANAHQLSNNCLFCNIIKGTEPAKIVAENDDILVFESIRPRHPSHWLIIPKKHIPNLKSAQPEDRPFLGKMLSAAGALGKQLQEPKAFNLQINEGSQAGQTVFHIHVHFYSDSALATPAPTI